MKNSFSLLEIILTILISSIIFLYTMGFAKEIFTKNKQSQKLEIKKVDLLFTKVFLQKHAKDLKEKLKYKNRTLYFDKNILLEEVEIFTISFKKNEITIFINLDNKIEQTWSFTNE